MKNVMFRTLFALVSALLFCACQGPQGPQGPAGEGVNWKIAELDVTNWDYTGDLPEFKGQGNNYYFAKFDVPALTSYVFTDGNVQVYLVENNKQHVLPFVRHQYEFINDSTINFFTRTIDAHFGIGWVQVDLRDSDFEYEVDETIVPGAMLFRVVMTY